MKSLATLIVLLVCLFMGSLVHAQTTCSGSTIMLNATCTGSGGKQIWDCNDVYNFDMMFCSGSQYFSEGIQTTGVTCTAGNLGKAQWNDDTGSNGAGWYEYCDGSYWWQTRGTAYSTCTGAERKKQQWNGTASSMQFCDGSNWRNMGPTVVRLTTSQTYVIPTYANGIIIQVWGGGGGGGATANNTSKGGDGGQSTATIASIGLSLTANGGVGGKDGANATLNCGSGAAGTASGTATGPPTAASGPTATTGGAGSACGAVPAAGNGGAAFKGGKAGDGTAAKGGGKASRDGGLPGSGGGGQTGSPASRKGGGGGGASGHVSVYYTNTGLSGLSLVVVIGTNGAGGSANAGDGALGLVTVTYW